MRKTANNSNLPVSRDASDLTQETPEVEAQADDQVVQTPAAEAEIIETPVTTEDEPKTADESTEADNIEAEEAVKTLAEDKLQVKAHYDATTKVAVASTDVKDRHGEHVNQEGWLLSNFKKNPVLLWAHDHSEIAVGNARNIFIERKNGAPRLVFTPDFHEHTDKARALKALYDEGRLNSFSVGFMPFDFDGATSTYNKQELLEISAVNVPANPEAMMLAYKSLKAAGIKDTTITELGITQEEKGAIADELAADAMQEQKMEAMEDVWEVMYALCDVYYNQDTPATSFPTLLGEVIGLLQQILDGTYTEDESEATEPLSLVISAGIDPSKLAQLSQAWSTEKVKEATPEPAPEAEIVDNPLEPTDSTANEPEPTEEVSAKVQDNSTAPAAQSATTTRRAEQSLVKVIATASDRLLQGEKRGLEQDERVKLQKVIKRAAEILSVSNKRK